MKAARTKTQTQRSVYVTDADWEAARELATRADCSISRYIVRLLRGEREAVLGKRWKPKTQEPTP